MDDSTADHTGSGTGSAETPAPEVHTPVQVEVDAADTHSKIPEVYVSESKVMEGNEDDAVDTEAVDRKPIWLCTVIANNPIRSFGKYTCTCTESIL